MNRYAVGFRCLRTGARGSIVALGFVVAGCGLLEPSSEHFLIRVDSVAVSSTIAAGDSFSAGFFGGIGPDGCWSLVRVDRRLTSSRLDLTFHGEHKRGRDVLCPQSPTSLSYTQVVRPPISSPFSITVHQPDGSLLHRLVTVQAQ